jgi:pyruvate dehydrogenase E2 component (dihydrolipoamide acetyltransferase)
LEEIFVPALGMAMEEAILLDWLKDPGDRVEVGDAIAEIETDKSTLELSATTAGRLGAHRAARGASVAVGSTVTVVLAEGEDEVASTDLASPPPADDGAVTAPATAPAEARTDPAPGGRAPHTISPRQRRLAAEARATSAPVVERATDPDVSSVRESIAAQVSRSWSEIPHFAVARDLDADGVLDRLSTEPHDDATKVSVTDVLVRALGRSLAPRGTSDVGLAVATPYGVLLAVLPDVADRDLSDIAQLRRAAVDRARSRRAIEVDARTPLVTLSNLGTHGVRWFTGIIPRGQQALLTTGTLEQRAVVRDGRLTVGWQLTAILNVDHRVWDGVDAAELLGAFAAEITSYGRYDDAR